LLLRSDSVLPLITDCSLKKEIHKMDFTSLFQYVPLLLKYAPLVKEILDIGTTNEDIATKIRKEIPLIVPFLEQYGSQLFPQAATAIHLVGGAIAAFDTNIVKWVQGACNNIIGTTLAVDGIYGKRTESAVKLLQGKLGLKVDGLAGALTQAAIGAALAKL
jgi:peptidoglycan hydrolase-like protein with peptidoglycan-binding domain